jgi:hypothetical protein
LGLGSRGGRGEIWAGVTALLGVETVGWGARHLNRALLLVKGMEYHNLLFLKPCDEATGAGDSRDAPSYSCHMLSRRPSHAEIRGRAVAPTAHTTMAPVVFALPRHEEIHNRLRTYLVPIAS